MDTYSCSKKVKAILIIITIALVAFAFIHSSMPADISSEESGNVLEFLQKILDFFRFYSRPYRPYSKKNCAFQRIHRNRRNAYVMRICI